MKHGQGNIKFTADVTFRNVLRNLSDISPNTHNT